MTNKINGIDVSECEKLGETIDGFTCGLGKRIRFANEIITKHNLCKDNPNCYFKQLKRLQEENKRLQMLSCVNCGEKYLSPDGAELYEKNVQLQKENEELKETINRLQKDCKRNNDLYMKEWDKNYKLSGISKEYNARRCIEKLYRLICDGTKSVQETYITLKDEVSEFLRIHKTMSSKYEEAKQTYKQALEEIREIAKHWLNNDWSCYHCRSNMDEKLKEIIKLTRL